MKNLGIELLAPVGSMEAAQAAVRTGAGAIYLGGETLSARHGAKNFSPEELKQVVSYCHGRGVGVHLALNTIVFDSELPEAEAALKVGAEVGVDAFIIQDLGMASLAKACAPQISRHASTQMSVHNLWGVEKLAKLGFSRVVLARELELEEIAFITRNSPIEIEAFVHGALCSSVSGQCYISGLIGGRSGNRGRCAQTCRLPFHSSGSSHALSLRDMSLIESLPQLRELGVASVKIEGRLKRPEYVAAAVTACVDILQGRHPNYDTLEKVFSRSGFTDGYLTGHRGDNMFGTRRKEDVISANSTLKELAGLYYKEQPQVAVSFHFTMVTGAPALLTATSNGVTVTASGPEPQVAQTAPTTLERLEAALEKTGGTPFYVETLTADLDPGLMLPVSQINALRRESLEQLLTLLEKAVPTPFTPFKDSPQWAKKNPTPTLRVRLGAAAQFSTELVSSVDTFIVPLHSFPDFKELKTKVLLELPRVAFGLQEQKSLEAQLTAAKKEGFTQLLGGDYGGVALGQKLGFQVHGDFGLNGVNRLATQTWKKEGLASLTMSLEYDLGHKGLDSGLPQGVLMYGYLPSMMFRNHPAGLKEESGRLTDRLGNQFQVERQGEASLLYNCVPLYLGDRKDEFKGLDFHTLYFTTETSQQVRDIVKEYTAGKERPKPYTRGLYQKRVL